MLTSYFNCLSLRQLRYLRSLRIFVSESFVQEMVESVASCCPFLLLPKFRKSLQFAIRSKPLHARLVTLAKDMQVVDSNRTYGRKIIINMIY